MARERATELDYLRWFCTRADFGPASEDVIEEMKCKFMDETGMNLPDGWNLSQDGETALDAE